MDGDFDPFVLRPEEPEGAIIDPASPTPGSDYLEAIVRDPRQDKYFRARCARDLLAYERPKLAVTALTTPEDFAARLDAAIRRSEKARAIDHEPPVHGPWPPTGPTPTPMSAPFPRLDRRI
jgi:hypothetical protein